MMPSKRHTGKAAYRSKVWNEYGLCDNALTTFRIHAVCCAADPHPGNVAVDRDGKLIYYDFGMCGSIPGERGWGGS